MNSKGFKTTHFKTIKAAKILGFYRLNNQKAKSQRFCGLYLMQQAVSQPFPLLQV